MIFEEVATFTAEVNIFHFWLVCDAFCTQLFTKQTVIPLLSQGKQLQ